jgi:predicted ATPase/DNA-binding CsgD family transcriptional regulator
MESENGRPAVSLPRQLGPIVGRRQELADVEALLATDRLVTLTGTGGSGKTRVALEVGATLLDRFPDGVVFVDLAPIRDPDLVPATIAVALGVRRHPRRTILDTLVGSIGEQRLLLILDNLEQLRGAESRIAALLGRCPSLHVLATSRAPLHVRGEREYAIGPLAMPAEEDRVPVEQLVQIESIALFVERARAVDSAFELSDANAPAIAEICRRLEGIPLAIELAAARSRLLTPAALLRRLDQRLEILTTGAADAPARQRTLRDTIAWSYDLLEHDERVLLARVGVFVGGFDPPAARAIMTSTSHAGEAELLEALGRLVDQSVLRVSSTPDGEPRFALLETIREFALEQLAPDEADDLARRHAQYFAALAETAAGQLGGFGQLPPIERVSGGGPDEAHWLDRVWRDIDNFRSAFEWARRRAEATLLARLAVALATFFEDFAEHREAGAWLHAAEEHSETLEPALRADLLFQLANYEIWHGGDRARLRRRYAECLAIRESLGDDVGAAFALTQLSAIAADLGHREEALELGQRALAVVDKVDDPLKAARLFVWFGLSLAVIDTEESPARAEEGIARGRAVGDRWTIALADLGLGWSALMTGDFDRAVLALSEARRILAELGSRGGTAHVISALGIALLRSGQAEEGRQLIREGCVQARAHAVWVVLAALEAAADWLGASGDPAAATVCWAVIDAQRALVPDRTYGSETGIYSPSRDRDRHALRPGEYEAARLRGGRMTLDEGLDYAIAVLDRAGAIGVEERPAAARRGRHDLTPREREVLALVADGRSDGEIADTLYISKKTASVHVASIKGKLGASSRVEMAMLARGIGPTDGQRAGRDLGRD